MRIVLCIQALIAVLGLAAVADQPTSNEFINVTINGSRTRRSPKTRHHSWFKEYYTHEHKLLNPGKLLSPRDNQMLLKQEKKNLTIAGSDCCPSVIEMIEPTGGKNQEGLYVELYSDDKNKQRFYEMSCHQDILNKPCRFIDKRLHEYSRCEQKYSYTYALVKDNKNGQRKNFPFPERGDSNWTLDYIRVRSGCSCVVVSPSSNRRKKGTAKHARRQHGHAAAAAAESD